MLTSTTRILLLGSCLAYMTPGLSQGYPTKPVRVVVGFSAGSTTDLIGARDLSGRAARDWRFDNRTGCDVLRGRTGGVAVR